MIKIDYIDVFDLDAPLCFVLISYSGEGDEYTECISGVYLDVEKARNEVIVRQELQRKIYGDHFQYFIKAANLYT